jgi:predicted DNA-binding antitoxin AbrB/MazE fold protein
MSKEAQVMQKHIRAIYLNGVFHPLEEVDLKEKSEVIVTVESEEDQIGGEVTATDPIEGISFASGLGDLSQR